MALKQSLKQKQKQYLSPLQLMTVRLLEIPYMGLESRIKEEFENNPVLEEKDEYQEEDSADELGWEKKVVYDNRSMNYRDREFKENQLLRLTETENPHHDLQQQLEFLTLNDKQKTIGHIIIGNLDDNGFFRRDIHAISDDLAFKNGMMVSNQEVEEVLAVVQQLEPPGVGARNVQESLIIQVQRKDGDKALKKDIIHLLEKFFTAYSNRNFNKIMTAMSIDEACLKQIDQAIRTLNPYPFSKGADNYNKNSRISPDAIIEVQDEDIHVILPHNSSKRLKINKKYVEMLEEYAHSDKHNKEQEEAFQFIKKKMEDAELFISSLNERQHTIEKVIKAIVEIQKEYFLNDENIDYLIPMKLQDVSDQTGYDKSTVSRVVNSKYVQTPTGIFSLKTYFSEGVKSTDKEELISNKVIKNRIAEIINQEDKKHPMIDEEIQNLLSEEGLDVTRRTVAKYREEMDIPTARLRRSL